jgi:N-acetylglucosaminyldiphosphoundecaprenol N-acetyl-beta-D-mannosaminyltransferase
MDMGSKSHNLSESIVRVILGIPVNAMTMSQVLDCVDTAIEKKEPLHIGVINAAKLVNMHRDQYLKDDVLASDLVLADGSAVVLAGKILGQPLPERVAGIDLMTGIFERGKSRNYRIFCLGATEEISEKVAKRIKQDYPGVVLAGRRNGYFSAEEEKEVAAEIAASKADVLFVAMTSPKKENFMAKWNDTMNVTVCHGVGGSFDVMAGKVERAPEAWQKLGLEWLYRVKQEPGRLWKRYLVTNTLFCWMVFKAWLNRLLGVR